MQLRALNNHLTFNNLFVSLRRYTEWDIGVFCAQQDSAEKFTCPFDSTPQLTLAANKKEELSK